MWVFFDENLTVDGNCPNKYTIKFACLYLKKCEREKPKTEIDCQIYIIRKRLENSFARNSFKGRKIVKYFPLLYPH